MEGKTPLSVVLEKKDKDRLLWKQRHIVVSDCLYWHFSSVKILMNRVHVQKKPSGPMGLPKPLLLGTPKYKLYINS